MIYRLPIDPYLPVLQRTYVLPIQDPSPPNTIHVYLIMMPRPQFKKSPQFFPFRHVTQVPRTSGYRQAFSIVVIISEIEIEKV